MKHDLLSTTPSMRHCLIMQKVGKCIAFELYDERENIFILACVCNGNLRGELLFTTIKDCHLRNFDDLLPIVSRNSEFLAKMSRDWLTGSIFSVRDRTDLLLSEIKFAGSVFETLPVSFKIQIFSSSDEPKTPLPAIYTQQVAELKYPVSNRNTLFSCFADFGCVENDQDYAPPRRFSNTSTNGYTTLENSEMYGVTTLQTKKPIWNSEINHWVNTFGGRVRIPSNQNFILTQSVVGQDGDFSQFEGKGPRGPFVGQILSELNPDRICVRHGKSSSSSYILDFREPASPLTAFAAACATYIMKPPSNISH